MAETFSWFSALGISVSLFLIIGFSWILIGARIVPMHNRGAGSTINFVSSSPDTAYFGGSPSELLASDLALSRLRTLLLTVIAGFLMISGVAFSSMAWFGLRAGELWVLISLGLAVVIAIGFRGLTLSRYPRSGVPLRIGDLPPFIWIPAALILPAVGLGWIGPLSVQSTEGQTGVEALEMHAKWVAVEETR